MHDVHVHVHVHLHVHVHVHVRVHVHVHVHAQCMRTGSSRPALRRVAPQSAPLSATHAAARLRSRSPPSVTSSPAAAAGLPTSALPVRRASPSAAPERETPCRA